MAADESRASTRVLVVGAQETSSSDLSDYDDSALNAESLEQIESRGEVLLWSAAFAVRDHDSESESDGPPVVAPADQPADVECPYPGLPVRQFTVDLDRPAAQRWDQVILAFRDELIAADREISTQVRNQVGRMKGAILESMASGILRTYAALGGVFFGAELAGISEITGIPLGRLILIQLVYDFSAACTSVVSSHEGQPVLFRNMDWEMPGLDLKRLTIDVQFVKDGRPVFRAATWAGCVGVFTGSKPNAFALSVNFRVTEEGTVWQNIRKGIGRGWPVSFLCREVLESAADYGVASMWLANSKTMSPTYITLVGTRLTDGCVITRDRNGEVPDRRLLGPCAQTNIDHWRSAPELDIMMSIQRRRVANRWLQDQADASTWHDFWALLATPPILNELTVYSVVMCPALDIFQVHVPVSDE